MYSRCIRIPMYSTSLVRKRKYVYNNDSIRNSGDNDNNSNSNNNTNNLNRSDKSQYINRNIDSCEIIIFRTNSENRPSSLRD